MKNLKRALSLVLATVMVIGMMVVGASAAGYADLTDKDEIVNKEAVAVVSELGLIVGYNGKFMPDGTIDRAGMAKLICLAKNGGKDPVLGTQDTPTYTDIKGHWAEAYIEYCSSLGIINGDGSGKFYPNAKLTGTAAAKMLLTALGYKSEVEGFVGDAWEINTNVKANMVGLYKNLDGINASAELTRDNAAQMVFNALNAYEVAYTNPVTVNGVVIGNSQLVVSDKTMLESRFNVTKVEGVVTANEWAVLDGDSDTALKAGLTRIENAEGIFADGTIKSATFNVTTPVEMLGQSVTLYIKRAPVLAKSEVVGSAIISTVNSVATVGDGDLADLLKSNGLTADKYTEYYVNYEEVDVDDFAAKVGAALTVIDNDSDGVAEYVVTVEKVLTHVTNVKSSTTALYGVGVIDDEDIMTEDKLAKNDIVLTVQYGGRTYIQVAEVVTGEMEMFNAKNTDPNKNYIKVEGEKYNEDELDIKSPSAVVTKFVIANCDTNNGVQFDTTYDFYMDDFGNIVAFAEVEGPATNYALALDSAYSINGLKTTADIQLMLADGTTKVYSVDVAASAAAGNFGSKANLFAFLGSNDDNHGAGTITRGHAAGNLVAYSIDEDGVVTIAPATLDAGKTVNGEKTNYNQNSGFFNAGQTWLTKTNDKGDLHNGDVDLWLDGATIKNQGFGIDEDTVIYYYNGKSATVVKGYDAMAKLIDATGSTVNNTIDNDVVYASVVAFNDATDVAEVVVLYTSQAKFGDDSFVYVMSVYEKAGDVYTYSVIDAEGNVLKMQSKTAGMANKLVTYALDGKYYVLTEQHDGVVHTGTAGSHTVDNDQGLIVTTRTKYIKVYDFISSNLMADGETVLPGFVNGVNSGNNTNWERYADKALVIDVANTDEDDKVAATTTLTSGQYGIVVYDGVNAVVVYVTNTYKMEVDPTAGAGNSNDEYIDYVTLNGKEIVAPTGYANPRSAVNNATAIKMSAGSDQAYTLDVHTTLVPNTTTNWFGTAKLYVGAEQAANTNLDNTNTNIATAAGVITIQGISGNKINTVTENDYVVVAVNANGTVTYYAYYFTK